MSVLGEKKTALVAGHLITYYRAGGGEPILPVYSITTHQFHLAFFEGCLD